MLQDSKLLTEDRRRSADSTDGSTVCHSGQWIVAE